MHIKILKAIAILPNFKGKGLIFQYFKQRYLARGFNPIVEAHGELGIIRIDLRSFEWIYFCQRSYDKKEMTFVIPDIDVNSNLIDVGANIGFWTIALAQHIRKHNGSGRVIAFEPHPTNFERLQENVALNDLGKIVEVHNVALSDHKRSALLVLREDFARGATTGNASIDRQSPIDLGFKTIEVQCFTADEFLKNKNIGFIKVDIEGHEINFFDGAKGIIKKERPKILFEINMPFFKCREITENFVFLKFESLLPEYRFSWNGNQSKSIAELKIPQLANILAEYK